MQGYNEFLNYLYYECGIQTLSVNLELSNDQFRRKYIPEKWKVGIDNYLLFIKNAVDVFGRGIEEICEQGCIPVLSAFIPDRGTDMASYERPSVEFLSETVERASGTAEKYGMALGPLCRPCTHNSLTMEEGSIVI